MSAANLDAVKKKYKFKEIAVATWQDPSLSVLSARGGPQSPTISPEAIGRPYIPTYKVKYNAIPQPTDDEESGHDDEGEESNAEPNIEPTQDSQVEPLLIESFEIYPKIEFPVNDVDDTQGTETATEEASIAEPVQYPVEERNSSDAVTAFEDFEPPLVDVIEDEAIGEIDSGFPVDFPVTKASNIGEEQDVETTIGEPFPHSSMMDSSDVPDLRDAMEAEEIESPTIEEHVDARRVSFAPGTPEPRPTPRKKKSPKGAKGKKKRIAVSMDSLPPDVMAMIDGTLGDLPPPPPPPPPPPLEDDATVVEEPSDEHAIEQIHGEPQPEGRGSPSEPPPESSEAESNLEADAVEGNSTTANVSEGVPNEDTADDGLPPANESAVEATEPPSNAEEATKEEATLESIDPGDETRGIPLLETSTEAALFDFSAIPPLSDDPPTSEKSSKKKGSKSGKDKSIKKPKNKSRETSPPPLGLGIDTGLPPIPDIDDLFKGLPPQPPPPLDFAEAVLEEASPHATDAPPDTTPEENLNAMTAEEGTHADATSLAGAVEEEQVVLAATVSEIPAVDSGIGDSGEVQIATSATVETEVATEFVNGDQKEANTAANESADAEPVPEPEDLSVLLDDKEAEVPQEAVSSPADSGVAFEDTGEKNIPVVDSAEESEKANLTEEIASTDTATDTAIEEPKLDDVSEIIAEILVEEVGQSTEQDVPLADEESAQDNESEFLIQQPADGEAPATEIRDSPPSEDLAGHEDAPEATELQPPESAVEEARTVAEDILAADLITPQATEEVVVEPAAPGSSEGSASADEPSTATANDGLSNESPPVEDQDASGMLAPEDDLPLEDTLDAIGSSEPVLPEQHEQEGPISNPPNEGFPVEDIQARDVMVDDTNVIESTAMGEELAEEANLPLEAPPSPNLSKSSSHSSHKHKADHWERKHADNALKEVFEDTKVLLRRHADKSKPVKDDVRVKDRSHRSKQLSPGDEEDEARRRRRALRKAEEAARLVEEEKRILEEGRARRIRREERRAARKAEAEAEEHAPRARENAETAGTGESEAKRNRHREQYPDRERIRPQREAKFKLPALTIPKALGFANGESVHGATLIRTTSGGYRQATSPSLTKRKAEPSAKEPPEVVTKQDAAPKAPSSNGDKSHHKHRHHRHRSESDQPNRSVKDGNHRHGRPVIGERPRSFFGTLMQGLER